MKDVVTICVTFGLTAIGIIALGLHFDVDHEVREPVCRRLPGPVATGASIETPTNGGLYLCFQQAAVSGEMMIEIRCVPMRKEDCK